MWSSTAGSICLASLLSGCGIVADVSCTTGGSATFAVRTSSQAASVQSQPSLGIVDGAATNGQPATWLLHTSTMRCTGFFVSPTTLITAGHCLPCDGSPVTLQTNAGSYNFSTAAAPVAISTNYFVSPNSCDTTEIDPQAIPYDLGAVFFGSPVSSNVVGIAANGSNQGDEVSFVGYGKSETSADTTPVVTKRVGSNALSADPYGSTMFDAESQPFFIAPPTNPDGSTSGNSAADHGDSGGPLFNADGKVIGLASGAPSVCSVSSAVASSSSKKPYNVFASLFGAIAQSFLADVVKAGGTLPPGIGG